MWNAILYNNSVEKLEILKAHLQDLADQCQKFFAVRSSNFISLNDLESLGFQEGKGEFNGTQYIVFGGLESSERCIVCFIPPYLEEEDTITILQENNSIYSLVFEPKSEAFSTPYGHRDVLGALMNEGIKRETIGDIIVEGSKAYVFLTKTAYLEAKGIDRIRNCPVTPRDLPLGQCPIKIKREEFAITVASNRLDLIVAASFHLSREEAQRFIAAKKVHFGIQERAENDSTPLPREKIYVEGKGKLRYLGEAGSSKKGKLILKLERYL